MWRIATFGLLVLAACGTTATTESAGDVMGQRFEVDGAPITLKELHEKDKRPIVFNLWATWCAPCLEEMPYLEAAYQIHKKHIHFVGLNISDSPTRAAEQAAELKITYLLGRDPEGDFTRVLGAVGLPLTGFVNRSGRLTYVHHGPIDLDTLESLIGKYLR